MADTRHRMSNCLEATRGKKARASGKRRETKSTSRRENVRKMNTTPNGKGSSSENHKFINNSNRRPLLLLLAFFIWLKNIHLIVPATTNSMGFRLEMCHLTCGCNFRYCSAPIHTVSWLLVTVDGWKISIRYSSLKLSSWRTSMPFSWHCLLSQKKPYSLWTLRLSWTALYLLSATPRTAASGQKPLAPRNDGRVGRGATLKQISKSRSTIQLLKSIEFSFLKS